MSNITRVDLIERWATAVHKVLATTGAGLGGLPSYLQAAVVEAASREFSVRGQKTTGFYLGEDNRQ